jgi:hypothetical protein
MKLDDDASAVLPRHLEGGADLLLGGDVDGDAAPWLALNGFTTTG